MKTEKKIVVPENGDVAKLQVIRHGELTLLTIFDRSSLIRPLIQAFLSPKEQETLIEALTSPQNAKTRNGHGRKTKPS